MSDVTWYRLSERAPTEADADELGHVLWCRRGNSPLAIGWKSSWGEPDKTHWRRLTPADYPPKRRKLDCWVYWPPAGGLLPPYPCSTQAFAEELCDREGGHIQRVEIVEELPEGER